MSLRAGKMEIRVGEVLRERKNLLKGSTEFLRCPSCGGEVRRESEALLKCAGCAREAPVRDGVILFTGGSDFYEHRERTEHRVDAPGSKNALKRALSGVYDRWAVAGQRLRFFKRVIPEIQKARGGSLNVLDLGCGKGWEHLVCLGDITGVDISFVALRQAAAIYKTLIRADLLEKFPFDSNHFDVIDAIDLIGHIAEDKKDGFLAELVRVARPGAQFVGVIETYSTSYDRIRQSAPDLFQKHIIDYHGHIGIEKTTATLARLEHAGLHVRSREILLPSPGYILGYATDAIKEFLPYEPELRIYRAWAQVATRSSWVEAATDIVFGLSHEVRRPFAPLDAGIGVLVHAVVEK